LKDGLNRQEFGNLMFRIGLGTEPNFVDKLFWYGYCVRVSLVSFFVGFLMMMEMELLIIKNLLLD
jgi:hypothetical protein